MKNTKMQQIAFERIYRLFELAESEMKMHPERSKRYVSLALEISKKARSRIPDELKAKFCKKCHAFLQEGVNSTIARKGTLTEIGCKECRFVRKIGRKTTKRPAIGPEFAE